MLSCWPRWWHKPFGGGGGGGGVEDRVWEPGAIGVGEKRAVCLSFKRVHKGEICQISPKCVGQRGKWRKPREKPR